MNLIDKMVRAYQRNETMPLKGHTKITLTDVHTGETKVIEKDNMVTNAVAEIFAKNWCGLARFAEILPIRNLFGGVLCFEGEVTESANNYNPPNDNANELICHAGDEAHTTGEATRGQPNVAEWDVQDTSIKYVWDFSTSVQGEIRTVCLCPGTFGNMGTKPFAATYNPLQSFGDNRAAGVMTWSDDIAKKFPWEISVDGKTCKTVLANGTTFTEYTRRHDYLAFGIMRNVEDWQDVSSRTATLTRSFDWHSFIFDDSDYYYVAAATSSTQLYVDKISKSDMSVTNTTLTFSGLTLYTSTFDNRAKTFCMRTFAYDGTYLYYPNGDGNKFCKLNLSNVSDVEVIPETIEIHKGIKAANHSAGEQFISPIVISAGLILGDNYVINGGHAYTISQAKQIGGGTGDDGNARFADIIKHGAGAYGMAFSSAYPTGSAGQSAVLNSMVLTTINVLDDVVNKTSSTTMKIEYTLTEV